MVEVKENDVAENSVEKVEFKENDVVENCDIDLQKVSENEVRVLHKHLFLNMYNEILHQAADILTQKNETPDEEKLKKLTSEILEEKINRIQSYLD